MINTAVIGEYKVMDILAICQKFKILWHFEILTWESMGKPKMWNILKTADRGVKRMKFGTRGTTVHGVRIVLLMPNSLSLVLGLSVDFPKFPILPFLKLCSSPNFHPIHPNFI